MTKYYVVLHHPSGRRSAGYFWAWNDTDLMSRILSVYAGAGYTFTFSPARCLTDT